MHTQKADVSFENVDGNGRGGGGAKGVFFSHRNFTSICVDVTKYDHSINR